LPDERGTGKKSEDAAYHDPEKSLACESSEARRTCKETGETCGAGKARKTFVSASAAKSTTSEKIGDKQKDL
jgi:hypothetical protein